MIQKILLAAATLVAASCSMYKMPTDDTITVVPRTNNPGITKEGNVSMTPGIEY